MGATARALLQIHQRAGRQGKGRQDPRAKSSEAEVVNGGCGGGDALPKHRGRQPGETHKKQARPFFRGGSGPQKRKGEDALP